MRLQRGREERPSADIHATGGIARDSHGEPGMPGAEILHQGPTRALVCAFLHYPTRITRGVVHAAHGIYASRGICAESVKPTSILHAASRNDRQRVPSGTAVG